MTADAVALPGAGTAAEIWRALGTVVDPEIPSISIVELGIVRSVEAEGDGWVVSITPTYSGCPATRVIEADIHTALAEIAPANVRVATNIAPPWTTDWIAPEARRKLREAGIAPPRHGASDAAATVRVLRGPSSRTRYRRRRHCVPPLRVDQDDAGRDVRIDRVQGAIPLRGLPRAFRLFQAVLTARAAPSRR